MKISIEKIKNKSYGIAELRFKNIQIINLCIFILNIFYLYWTFSFSNSTYNSTSINIYIIISVFMYILIIIWDKNYTKYRDIAEELRLIQFNKANLHVELSPEKKSYLLPKILDDIINWHDAEIDYNSNYFENQNLKYSLLQNIFLTQNSYGYHANFYLKVLWLLILTIILFLSFLVFFISKVDGNQSFILQIILTFIILVTTTRYYLVYHSFKIKSKALKELDDELTKTNSSDENKAISILLAYNTLLVDAYPTYSRIYNKHKEVLNMAWNERITSFSKETLLIDFKENIEKDLKILLSTSNTFKYKGYQIIGSYIDESFINGKSDLDILLVFEHITERTKDKFTPKFFYYNVYNLLKIRFGNNLIKSLPSYIVQNFSDITIEFTPCLKVDNERFKIVNSYYNFEDIFPLKYNDYFKTCNDESSGLFNSLIIKVMKWKYNECCSISSIYLKFYLSNLIMMAGNEISLSGFLKELINTQLNNIDNPIEPNKSISACYESEKAELIEKIQNFIKRTENAEK
jgi:hypothetical protein